MVSAGLLCVGLVRQIGGTEVSPEKVQVSADDVVPPVSVEEDEIPSLAAPKPSLPKSIREKTVSIYRRDFAGHERSENKITEEQMIDLVWSEETISAFDGVGDVGLIADDGTELVGKTAVMADALNTISAATSAKDYVKQLVGYRDAKKVNLCTNETRTRRRTVQGWDSYSTSCAYWYDSPIGCPTTRVIAEPYTEKVCEMKYPADLVAPSELFAASVSQYAEMAKTKLESSRIDAEKLTAENFQKKVKGQANIGESGKLFLGFLAVMFLYLFIAMERHNRHLRRLTMRDDSDKHSD